MTARARINRQMRIIGCIYVTGFAVFVLGMFIAQPPGAKQLPVILLIGYVVAWLTSIYLIGIRCPMCRGRLTQLAMHRGFLGIPPRMRFCPYCGASLDDDESTQS
jgi:hypothetical protein